MLFNHKKCMQKRKSLSRTYFGSKQHIGAYISLSNVNSVSWTDSTMQCKLKTYMSEHHLQINQTS